MERFKEWLGYCGSVLFLEFCSLFTGIGWLPAVGLEVLGIISGEYTVPITVGIMVTLLLIVPIFLMIKEHGFPRFTGSYIKTFFVILISFTIGLAAGAEEFIDLSSAVASITKGGYDAGYEDGLKEGKELAAESHYDSGYDDGYDDALADLIGTTTVTRKPTVSDDTGRYVYITATGEKYHKQGCQYLRDSCYKITYGEAVVDGYEPCSRCY